MSEFMTASGDSLNTMVCVMPPPMQMDAVILTSEEFDAFLMKSVKNANAFRTEMDIARQTPDQLQTLRKILKEFGHETKAYSKVINGKKYVIIKGRPGLRKVFTAPKYGWNNAKAVSYGMGSQAGKLLRGSFVSIIFVSAFNIIETIVRDDKDFIDATAQLTTDIVKTVAAGVAAAAFSAAAATLGAPIVLAVGGAILVGIVVSKVLDEIDASLNITQSLSDWFRKYYDDAQQDLQRQSQEMKRTWRWCNSPEGAAACIQQMFGGR